MSLDTVTPPSIPAKTLWKIEKVRFVGDFRFDNPLPHVPAASVQVVLTAVSTEERRNMEIGEAPLGEDAMEAAFTKAARKFLPKGEKASDIAAAFTNYAEVLSALTFNHPGRTATGGKHRYDGACHDELRAE